MGPFSLIETNERTEALVKASENTAAELDLLPHVQQYFAQTCVHTALAAKLVGHQMSFQPFEGVLLDSNRLEYCLGHVIRAKTSTQIRCKLQERLVNIELQRAKHTYSAHETFLANRRTIIVRPCVTQCFNFTTIVGW